MTVCAGGGLGWFEIVQLVGVAATGGALVFTAVELRASARERARLRHRLRHERLEDLAIAISRAQDSIATYEDPKTIRDVAEVRARLFGFAGSAHPNAWQLAEWDFGNPAGPRPVLLDVAKRALDETQEHLRVSSLSLDE